MQLKQDKRFRLTRAQVREANRLTLERAGDMMLEQFQASVATWETAVDFEKRVTPGKSVTVSTDSEVYGFVDGGTRAHRIEPRFAKALAFTASYAAKTAPGVIGSGAGGGFGETVHSRGVNHPGTEARGFTKTIEKDMRAIAASLWREAVAEVRGG